MRGDDALWTAVRAHDHNVAARTGVASEGDPLAVRRHLHVTGIPNAEASSLWIRTISVRDVDRRLPLDISSECQAIAAGSVGIKNARRGNEDRALVVGRLCVDGAS